MKVFLPYYTTSPKITFICLCIIISIAMKLKVISGIYSIRLDIGRIQSELNMDKCNNN